MYAAMIDPIASPTCSPNFQLTVNIGAEPPQRTQSGLYGKRLVSHFRDGNIEAWCLGRLYYTHELASRYRIGNLVVGREAEFIARLVAIGGCGALAEIEGDYALAVVDYAQRKLFACRDAFGGYPLYFFQNDNEVVLGTSSPGLSRQLGQTELSKEFLGRFLSLPMAIYSETLQGISPFENIHAVLPGQLVRFDMVTGQRTTQLFQGFADAAVDDVAYRSPKEFQDAVYHATIESVAQRAAGNVCCHSSSGMDSTVVSTIANRLYDERKTAGNCHAITMVYEKDPSLRGESKFIDVVHRCLTIPTHKVNGDACVNYGPMASGIRCQPGDANAFLTRLPIHAALTNQASELDADTILTGAGGDHLFENHPAVLLADDIVDGRLISAFRRSWLQSRRTGASRIQSVRSAVQTIRWHQPTFCRTRSPRILPWNLQSEFDIPDWYQMPFVQNSLMASQMQTGISGTPGGELPLSWYYKAIYAPAMGDQMRWTLAAPLGIHIAHPYFDRSLCSLVLNAPLALRYGFERDKGLSAAIFSRELPAELVARKSKIGLRDLMTRGFSEHHGRLQNLVGAAPACFDEIVDRGKLLAAIKLASLGVFQSAIALDRLNLALALAYWLSAVSRASAGAGPTES